MRRNFARGSGNRGRGIGHDRLRENLVKAFATTAAFLIVAACATTSHRDSSALEPAHSPEAKGAQQISAAQFMIDGATSMIGQRYRFGGDAPGGFDCSGLVVYAAARAGIRMPRTTAEQLHMGLPVARTELAPGDLIFMRLTGKGLHVAIALDSRLFVHAPSAGGRVRVDSLIAAPYSKGFIGARRVVLLGDQP